MKFYMGADLSLTSTGIVILNENKEVCCTNRLLQNLRGPRRLEYLRNEIKRIALFYKPKLICIEDYAMGIRAGQSFSIGELGGVIKLMLYESGFEPILVSPTRLKKFITGKGNSEKDMMMMSILKQFGFESASNDEADAYGLARLAYVADTGDTEGLTNIQKEAMEDTINPPDKKTKKEKKAKKAKPLVRRVKNLI